MKRLATLILLLLLCVAAPRVQACATCFGDPNSNMTQGMLAGVLVLLLIVVAVLGGFIALFVHLARKSAAVAALENQTPESKA